MSESFQHGELKLDIRDTTITLLGRSTARDPGNFLGPILMNTFKQAIAAGRALILDFRKLEYMNSSTITPVIRLLHEAKKGTGQVTITYDGKSRWQDLSFSALTIFTTEDKRIEIRGE